MRSRARLKRARTFEWKSLKFSVLSLSTPRPGHLALKLKAYVFMKLSRTTNYNFGWVVLIALVDVAFLLVFFLLLSSNFILQQGISISMPFSRFTLGPQTSHQIISISGGAVPAIYFQDQRVTMEQLGPLLEAAKRNDQSIIIKADRSTSYETVAEVANAALEHGITAVALAASPPR